jgi:type II secretory pathway component PulK
MEPATQSQQSLSQKGVAIIAVLASLAILGGAVAEFSTDTTVDGVSAANARDDMQTHFLARSGANLTQLIIKLQTDVVDKYRQQLGDFQIADYAGMFMGAFGGGREEVDAMAEMLGGFKGDAIKGLGVAVGTFDVVITTDDGRINMNCANGTQQTQENLKAQLEALFYFEAFDPIFESEDAEGWRRDRATQASALIDYIDRDRAGFGQPGTQEEYGYETLDDRYRAKNNYVDTISELKLVRGIDDRMWTLFGDQFTAYGDCKVNIGAVADPKLIAAILFLAAKNPDDPVVKDPLKLWALARAVIEARTLGVYFDDLNSFAEFVKDPQTSLTSLFSTEQADGTTPAPPPTGAQGMQVEGLELDATKLGQVARSGPRRIYRVEVVATVPRGVEGTGNDYVKRLVAVWDTKTQNQNNRDPSAANGAWVYWREE